MLFRHILESGAVLYFMIDELPADVGNGFHAMLTTRDSIVAAESFGTQAAALAWMQSQKKQKLIGHQCSSGCYGVGPVPVP